MCDDLLRDLAPQVLGSMARRYRDFAAAEDAVQEALLAAALQWPTEGVPVNPRGWLIQVATRRMTDHQRSEEARRQREMEFGYVALGTLADEDDDTLPLVFLCCHPALTNASAIALTLRAIGGLTTAEIARAFLVPESTMAQRISRAKDTIRTSGIPFEMPSTAERAARLQAVRHVLYLIFNEGYLSSSGDSLQRRDLAAEAIRLTRLLLRYVPEDGETRGLLALMLLTDARRGARTGALGELIPLAQQDRTAWNRVTIAEGAALLPQAFAAGAPGMFTIQAAIAALHDEAPSVADTDWPQIVALYEVLRRLGDSPIVELNYAVAVSMVHGPEAGLAIVDRVSTDLEGSHRVAAVRGHLLEMSGQRAAAVQAFERAAESTASLPERNYLLAKAASLLA